MSFQSKMFVTLPRGTSFPAFHLLVLGLILLAYPVGAYAQRRGGTTSSTGQGGLETYSRPDGVDEKDSLQDFHHVLAVQATSQQIAEFQTVVKATDAAKAELQTFVEQLAKGQSLKEKSAPAEFGAALDPTWQSARSKNQHFEEGFSATQKDGLREITKRLDKAESDVEQERTKLTQSLRAGNSQDVSSRVDGLGRALTEFSNDQLALGREMSIVVASAQDLSFNLHAVKAPVTIQGRTVAIIVSGALTQIEEQNGQRTFNLELDEDLSDLQQNIGALLNAQLSNANQCGERLAVRQAMLTPSAPSSLLVLRMHYERWSCIRSHGQTTSNELAESDGTVEVKLTPAVGQTNALKLNSEFGPIDPDGMFADSLRSGDLGDNLRDKISASVLAALRVGTEFKTTLPPALQNSAAIQSVQFRDAGAGVLNVVLEGRTQISNEQVNLLASQLNQALSAQSAGSQ
jgi:hypothetical protein